MRHHHPLITTFETYVRFTRYEKETLLQAFNTHPEGSALSSLESRVVGPNHAHSERLVSTQTGQVNCRKTWPIRCCIYCMFVAGVGFTLRLTGPFDFK